jgi:hypothetical protein
MQRLDVAGAAGRWLANPAGASGRIGTGASRLAADVLESLDQERLGGMAKGAIAARLRAIDIAPLFGQALGAAIAKQRHLPLLDGMIRWAAKMLAMNEHLIREMVHSRAGGLMRWTGLDETLANKIIEGLDKLLTEMAEDPHHPLRAKAEEGLERSPTTSSMSRNCARRSRRSSSRCSRTRRSSAGSMGCGKPAAPLCSASPAIPARRLGGRWASAAPVRRDAPARQEARQHDQPLRPAQRGGRGDGLWRRHRPAGLGHDRGWDAQTITGRLENAVGRDLQYIRINGTVVGGLVGVAIHAVDTLL